MNNHRLLWLIALLTAVVLVAGGCSCNDDDDDDDNDDNDDSDFQASSISFDPAGPGTTGQIWLELDQADPATNSFTLKVLGDGLDGYGVAGRMNFDRLIAALDAAKPGDALEGNSAVIVAKGGDIDAGGVFGVSRSGDFENTATISSDKIIGTLEFSVSAAGTTAIDFDADRSSILDAVFEKVEVDSWLGGTLTVE